MFGGCYSVQYVVWLLVVAMAASPSRFFSSQLVASLQSSIQELKEVSVAGVVRVCPCLT